MTFHSFVPVSTQGGYAFWQHHNSLPPDGTVHTNPMIQKHAREEIDEINRKIESGIPVDEATLPLLSQRGLGYIYLLGDKELYGKFENLSEPEVDRNLKKLAFIAIKDRPFNFLKKVIKKQEDSLKS
jgi:hypothetical protein